MAKRIVATKTPSFDDLLDARLLGRFIRARRTQMGVGITTAAMLCDVSVSALQGLETKGSGRLETALKVCRKLGVRLHVEPWEDE